MKKGISLIVLVITIIVMIIIAGAIIISLNSTNVINRADEAVIKSDLANLKSELTLYYTEVMLTNNADSDDSNNKSQTDMTLAYKEILDKYPRLESAGYDVSAAKDLTYVIDASKVATSRQ